VEGAVAVAVEGGLVFSLFVGNASGTAWLFCAALICKRLGPVGNNTNSRGASGG
jgi:hypothetical protein